MTNTVILVLALAISVFSLWTSWLNEHYPDRPHFWRRY